jgi:asparagine synthase (glutamine-hydrolysing)
MYLLMKHISENTDFKVVLSGEGADELFMGYNVFAKAPEALAANSESERQIKNIHMFDGLRADRTCAAHGLELRVPFLDIDLIHYVLAIPGVHKMYKGFVEKQLLRDAFKHMSSLQYTRILDRAKERFSDGCGFGYVPRLLTHWSSAHDLLSKQTAERKAYMEIFDKIYPNHRSLIIDRVNPSWCSSSSTTDQLLCEPR